MSKVNEQYIKAHLGWSVDSKVLKNYANQTAIKRPDQLNNAIQKDYYSEVIKENDELKFKQKLQQDQIQKMLDEMQQMRREQLKIFDKMDGIDVSTSKNLIKTIFEEMKNGTIIKS